MKIENQGCESTPRNVSLAGASPHLTLCKKEPENGNAISVSSHWKVVTGDWKGLWHQSWVWIPAPPLPTLWSGQVTYHLWCYWSNKTHTPQDCEGYMRYHRWKSLFCGRHTTQSPSLSSAPTQISCIFGDKTNIDKLVGGVSLLVWVN